MAISVVINAAGSGSRLGRGVPKSLVEVCGRSILEWQLTELCRRVRDVYVVVGFQAEAVAGLARRIRPDVQIVVNERWAETKTAGSLSLAAARVGGRCVSLDGDVLVAAADFERLLRSPTDAVGICRAASSEPIFARLDGAGRCVGFSYTDVTTWEWSCLVQFDARRVPPHDGHVFEMIECILPTATVEVRSVEIDTPQDLLSAERRWQRILGSRHAA
jgi:choline kinase